MPTATTQTAPTMCLRHGDFHVMDSDCWGVTLDWYTTHQHLGDQAGQDLYLAAVEREMLDNLIRSRS